MWRLRHVFGLVFPHVYFASPLNVIVLSHIDRSFHSVFRFWVECGRLTVSFSKPPSLGFYFIGEKYILLEQFFFTQEPRLCETKSQDYFFRYHFNLNLFKISSLKIWINLKQLWWLGTSRKNALSHLPKPRIFCYHI